MYKLTSEGEKYAKEGLPEKRLLKLLPSNIIGIQKNIKDASIAISNAKKKGWIKFNASNIEITQKGKDALNTNTPEEDALKKMVSGNKVNSTTIKELLRRKLIEEIKEDVIKKARDQLNSGIQYLTPELIKSGLWKEAKLKEYNVSIAKRAYGGREHFLKELIEQIKEILISMGFNEMRGPLVENSFYNFDLLFIPQDHPGRDEVDTFFLKTPGTSKSIPEISKITSQVHENGWKTGSTGWGYKWDQNLAKENIMRTHTTATTFRILSKGIITPCKYFTVDRIFRNETIDQTHLFEFHQIEGFVAEKNLTLRNIMGIFREFYSKLGVEKLRFKPVYNPYTEPSIEVYGYYEKLGEWIEMGNSGMFRPETLLPLKIDTPVIAWGLGLERLAMLIHDIDDIRQVLGSQVSIQSLRETEVLR